eukprot:m.117487 g.117487  ORF g.117487 m.117487 type:complete len:223 (+) comp51974_c0_seq8:867-1535(+)
MLEFSSLGFVAKLFRDHTVAQLAAFFKEFYREHPVDFLLQYYLQLLDGESGKHTRIPTIFIHKGTHSSLHGKKQLLEDPLLQGVRKQFPANPPAEVASSMDHYMAYTPAAAYTSKDSFFWAMSTSIGDHFTISFRSPQSVNKIVILTGKQEGEKEIDLLEHGELQICRSASKTHFETLATFKHGRAEVTLPSPIAASAVRVLITKDQASWLIIRDVGIFVAS